MKCPKCKVRMKLYGEVTVLEASVLINLRCEECFSVYTFDYSQPHQLDINYEPPRLKPCSGDINEQWRYFKCHKPKDDCYTLVAKRKLATRARLEELGYTVEDPTDTTTNAGRLYELA